MTHWEQTIRANEKMLARAIKRKDYASAKTLMEFISKLQAEERSEKRGKKRE